MCGILVKKVKSPCVWACDSKLSLYLMSLPFRVVLAVCVRGVGVSCAGCSLHHLLVHGGLVRVPVLRQEPCALCVRCVH